MTSLVLSEEQLRARLAEKFSGEQIDTFIDQYDAAGLAENPDLDVISDLAKRGQEDKYLRVNFKLTNGQYDALATYFGETQKPAAFLVQKALEEFIQLVAS
jgi:hypothetical protein